MGGIVLNLLGALANALRDPSSAGSDSEALHLAVDNIYGTLSSIARGVVYVFYQVWGAKQYELPLAQQIGKDMETVQGANENSMDHIAYTILPNSLNYLQGFIFSTGIVPLRAVTKQLADTLTTVQKRLTEDENWLYNWVVPSVKDYYAFKDAFYKGDQPSINVLIDWLHNPAGFGTWAAPPLIGPLVAYLADRNHQATRDNLASIMVNAWSEEPDTIWGAVQNWLVAQPR